MSRKQEPERGPATGAALGFDRASVLFENATADSEPKSGATGPGAESRAKDARQVALGNAWPGIAHYDFHAAARQALGHRALRAPNREPSATRHEAKRVERQVEQHLLEAVPVGMNRDPVEAVDDLHFDPRLLGQRQEKLVGP